MGFLILWVVCSGVIWFVYHSIFNVMYFEGGFTRELIKIAAYGLVGSYLILMGFAKNPFLATVVTIIAVIALYSLAKSRK